VTQYQNILKMEERYSRVPRVSGTKGKWRYASSKARLKCAIYPRSQYMVMCYVKIFFKHGNCGRQMFWWFVGVRVGVANIFFGSIDRYWLD